LKKILVTGGAGFIGSTLVSVLSNTGRYSLTVIDNLSTGKIDNIKNILNVNFVKCDVNRFDDVSGVFYSSRFDYVFHFAAVVGVQRTLANPVSVLEDIEGIRNILLLSKNTGVRKIFFASSSEVYGEPVSLPQHEYSTPLNSRLPYAIVKNVGEAYCRSFYREYGLKYQILRFFNTYGPRQSSDFVVSRFLSAALNGTDITIFGDGSQTRTFCFIDDNIDCIVKLICDEQLSYETVNIGSDICVTILELARLVIKLTGSTSRVIHLEALKEGDMSRRQPDNQIMMQILDRPLVSLESGLGRILTSWTQIPQH